MGAALRGAVRLYYRLEIGGETVPRTGAVLLVANHPNSLLDAAMVTLAARRHVRFLAKSTLFDDRTLAAPVRWLVRASGAIPVYRRVDGAAPSGGNDEAFRAVRAALAEGAAVALFPEGISHARSSLAPLKTGAARLTLGAARTTGHTFPIVPVGLLLDDRAVFRSTARVIVGAPIAWDDLAHRGESDATAVRDLTDRIQVGLRSVTLNYASWEDAHLIALADAVHATTIPRLSATDHLVRQSLGVATLTRLRDLDDPAWRFVADDLRDHARLLRALGLTPEDLVAPTDVGTALGWGLRRIPLLALAGITSVGTLLAWPAYRVVGPLASRAPHARDVDVHATAKLLVGAVVFLVWTALLATAVGLAAGPWAGLLTLLIAPALALVALLTAEGWQSSWRDARRFLTLRHRRERIAMLRERQRALAQRIESLVASAAVSSDGQTRADTPPAARSH
jgi:glycerol-3-phosphate O-acyltransferase / dihydroxyacetone phosphate acyltransferase